jgi:hypothetical protein
VPRKKIQTLAVRRARAAEYRHQVEQVVVKPCSSYLAAAGQHYQVAETPRQKRQTDKNAEPGAYYQSEPDPAMQRDQGIPFDDGRPLFEPQRREVRQVEEAQHQRNSDHKQ